MTVQATRRPGPLGSAAHEVLRDPFKRVASSFRQRTERGPLCRPSDWTMGLPFTVEQFHGVFRDYNIAVWLAQWSLVAMVLLPFRSRRRGLHWAGCDSTQAHLPLGSRFKGHDR